MSTVSFRFAVATTVFVTLFTRSAAVANPPLEQLGLRDALLAKPEVIAALLPPAHQQLALRFEEARRHPGDPQELLVAPELGPVEVIRTLDRGRLARGREALIAGEVRITPLGIEVPFFTDEPAAPPDTLPPLEGVPAGATAEAETTALHGTAGAVLQALLLHSQATHLVRVVSWPVAAVAIQDVVYVNAAWLLALGPQSAAGATPPASSVGAPVEAGCGGAVVESAQGSLPTSRITTYVSEPAKSEPEHESTSSASRAPVATLLRGGEESHQQTDPPQYLWSGGSAGSGAVGAAESRTTTTGLPISSLTYALDSAADAATDCCRYTSSGGCNTEAPCKSSSSSCSSGSGSGCSSGSGSGCNSGSGSGCSSGSGGGCSSGSGSGCSSGSGGGCSSGSGGGCSSGSGGGCSSGSGGGCSSGSGSSCSGSGSSCSGSGSSCGSSSSGSCGKCSTISPRPRGEIPDPVTVAFLLAPLAFLVLQERRWRR